MNVLKSFKDEVLVPIHPAGWPFIFLFILVSAAISYLWTLFVLPGILLSLWCIYFFRNPTAYKRIRMLGIYSSHKIEQKKGVI